MKAPVRTGLLLFLFFLIFLSDPLLSFAGQATAIGGTGSAQFGAYVRTLPNGNIVVIDSQFTNAGVAHAGAVYLFNQNLAPLAMLTGTSTNDQVGSGGVTVLANGNYVVSSPHWNGGLGAATWCSASGGGLTRQVSSGNSLVGDTAGDLVGTTITPLTNGNYVVSCLAWHNDAGAATCCSGLIGFNGVVSGLNSLTGYAGDELGSGGITALANGSFVVCSPYINSESGQVSWCNGQPNLNSGYTDTYKSLVGSTPGDLVGSGGIVVLPSGNYLVLSPSRNYLGTGTDAGAVTWCNGSTGYAGTVFNGQSLIGSQAGQEIGSGGVIVLANGNYLVISPLWNGNTGAVTWGNGTTGLNSEVASINSLTGSYAGIVPLPNGNYLVYNPGWNKGTITQVGAVSYYSGTGPATGTAINGNGSLTGTLANDEVGSGGIVLLTNGNYVVCSPNWSNTVGAVTWCRGITGRNGTVSGLNSLTGRSTNDQLGSGGVTGLPNGNYVVCSPAWSNTIGAVTWCPGALMQTGVVSGANSVVGSTPGDQAGSGGITVLANSNFVINTPSWSNAGVTNSGAITWATGMTNSTGVISSANSLVGNVANTPIGTYKTYFYNPCYPVPAGSLSTQIVSSVSALPNGNYVVASPYWGTPTVPNAGAVTWGNGTAGTTGLVSSANSLVGSSAQDHLGSVQTHYTYLGYPNVFHSIAYSLPSLTVLPNGNYVVASPSWANGSVAGAGAVTWGSGATGVVGTIASANSLIGDAAGENIGSGGCVALTNGDDIVFSPGWINGTLTNAGAISWANNPAALTGTIAQSDSVTGNIASGGPAMVFAYDYPREGVVVGCPAGNAVVLLYNRITQTLSFPAIAPQYSPGSVTLNATSSAGLPVSYTLVSGPATLNGNQLLLNGPGTVSVAAAQPGEAATLPAASLTNAFSVTARVIEFATNSTALTITNGGFKFQTSGFTSHGNIIIYSSTNLLSWRPIFTNPPVTGSLQILDTNASRQPVQYYRVAEE